MLMVLDPPHLCDQLRRRLLEVLTAEALVEPERALDGAYA